MNYDISTLLPLGVYSYMLVFCRVGSVFMIMPGIGDGFVPMRIRLVLALLFSMVMTPVISQKLPPLPDDFFKLSLIIIAEIIYGIFIGLIGRFAISCMHTAGLVIATNSGLATAMLFDHNQGTQGTAIGNFLGLAALLIIFATPLHQQMFIGIAESYDVFASGSMDKVQDMYIYLQSLLSNSFNIAMRISSPIMVVTVVIYAAGGILSRLMPAFQVFFIMVPVQIIVGFFLMAITLSAVYGLFEEYFSAAYIGGIDMH